MHYEFRKLTQRNAMTIADDWKYENPYSFYDMTADEEDYKEFINEEKRNKNDYFEVIQNNQLVGFFCCFGNNNEIEMGLGLKPDFCGKGVGKTFLDDILKFILTRYKCKKVKMNVATFNKRAINVYHSCGFIDIKVSNRNTNGGVYEFLTLYREI